MFVISASLLVESFGSFTSLLECAIWGSTRSFEWGIVVLSKRKAQQNMVADNDRQCDTQGNRDPQETAVEHPRCTDLYQRGLSKSEGVPFLRRPGQDLWIWVVGRSLSSGQCSTLNSWYLYCISILCDFTEMSGTMDIKSYTHCTGLHHVGPQCQPSHNFGGSCGAPRTFHRGLPSGTLATLLLEGSGGTRLHGERHLG